MASEKGFTLLEILVALSILVVILGLSIANFTRHTTTNRLLVNLNSSRAFFDTARLSAQALNREFTVSINLNTNGGGQFILLDTTESSAEKQLAQQIDLDPGLPVTINPRNVRRIIFTPKGAIKLYNQNLVKLSTQNCKFTFDYLQANTTINLIIYANTGEAQIVQ